MLEYIFSVKLSHYNLIFVNFWFFFCRIYLVVYDVIKDWLVPLSPALLALGGQLPLLLVPHLSLHQLSQLLRIVVLAL